MITAVIGHGRSPERRGWGARIDACERVVRMWDWHWQKPADYGSRYDYGLIALYPKGLEAFYKSNRRTPSRGWIGYNLKPWGKNLPKKCTVLDTEVWRGMARAMGGRGTTGGLNLTRGTAAACWSITTSSPGDAVVLVGFDNIHAGVNMPWEQAFSPEYTEVYLGHFAHNKSKVYPEGETKTATHDMLVERPLMVKLASDAGVKLQFAQDVWNGNED